MINLRYELLRRNSVDRIIVFLFLELLTIPLLSRQWLPSGRWMVLEHEGFPPATIHQPRRNGRFHRRWCRFHRCDPLRISNIFRRNPKYPEINIRPKYDDVYPSANTYFWTDAPCVHQAKVWSDGRSLMCLFFTFVSYYFSWCMAPNGKIPLRQLIVLFQSTLRS